MCICVPSTQIWAGWLLRQSFFSRKLLPAFPEVRITPFQVDGGSFQSISVITSLDCGWFRNFHSSNPGPTLQHILQHRNLKKVLQLPGFLVSRKCKLGLIQSSVGNFCLVSGARKQFRLGFHSNWRCNCWTCVVNCVECQRDGGTTSEVICD